MGGTAQHRGYLKCIVGGGVLNKELAKQIRVALRICAEGVDDSKRSSIAAIYDPWIIGVEYAAGDFLTYGVEDGKPVLYKVIQGHTSQSDWKPDIVPALYKKV